MDWLNPLDKLKFQSAVKTRAPWVELRNGRRLALDYKYRKGQVRFTPIPTDEYPDDFIPMGFIRIEVVTDESWLDDGAVRTTNSAG